MSYVLCYLLGEKYGSQEIKALYVGAVKVNESIVQYVTPFLTLDLTPLMVYFAAFFSFAGLEVHHDLSVPCDT